MSSVSGPTSFALPVQNLLVIFFFQFSANVCAQFSLSQQSLPSTSPQSWWFLKDFISPSEKLNNWMLLIYPSLLFPSCAQWSAGSCGDGTLPGGGCGYPAVQRASGGGSVQPHDLLVSEPRACGPTASTAWRRPVSRGLRIKFFLFLIFLIFFFLLNFYFFFNFFKFYIVVCNIRYLGFYCETGDKFRDIVEWKFVCGIKWEDWSGI